MGDGAMNKLEYYNYREALLRKQAEEEPASREKHLADAEAWRVLAVTRSFVAASNRVMRERLSKFEAGGAF